MWFIRNCFFSGLSEASRCLWHLGVNHAGYLLCYVCTAKDHRASLRALTFASARQKCPLFTNNSIVLEYMHYLFNHLGYIQIRRHTPEACSALTMPAFKNPAECVRLDINCCVLWEPCRIHNWSHFEKTAQLNEMSELCRSLGLCAADDLFPLHRFFFWGLLYRT